MLNLTPAMLEAAYELLRATPPFKRWKLPDPDDLEFRAIVLTDGSQGELWARPGKPLCLTVNPNRHNTIGSMIMTLAHEMVHIREEQLNVKGTHHGRLFHKLADQVCSHHGFDRGQF